MVSDAQMKNVIIFMFKSDQPREMSSFKILTAPSLFDRLLNLFFWPAGALVKENSVYKTDAFRGQFKKQSDKLTVLYQNTRGLNKKLTNLRINSIDCDYDVENSN